MKRGRLSTSVRRKDLTHDHPLEDQLSFPRALPVFGVFGIQDHILVNGIREFGQFRCERSIKTQRRVSTPQRVAMGLGYVRCQKSQEAVMNLRKMVEAARVYYTSDHASRGSNVAIPNQFPGLGLDYGPAPGVNTCCGQPKDQCRPDPKHGTIPCGKH